MLKVLPFERGKVKENQKILLGRTVHICPGCGCSTGITLLAAPTTAASIREGRTQISIIAHKTVYESIPAQLFMTRNIKTPAMAMVKTVFDPSASMFSKVMALWRLWKVYRATCKLPDPSLEMDLDPNARNLVILRNWLFKHCFLADIRMGFVRQVFKFTIILMQMDQPWRWILDNVREEAMKMKWQPKGDKSTEYIWWK